MDNTKNRILIGIICSIILISVLVTYLMFSNRGENETEIEDFASENLVQENEETNKGESKKWLTLTKQKALVQEKSPLI